jgi:hypothetical protein
MLSRTSFFDVILELKRLALKGLRAPCLFIEGHQGDERMPKSSTGFYRIAIQYASTLYDRYPTNKGLRISCERTACLRAVRHSYDHAYASLRGVRY